MLRRLNNNGNDGIRGERCRSKVCCSTGFCKFFGRPAVASLFLLGDGALLHVYEDGPSFQGSDWTLTVPDLDLRLVPAPAVQVPEECADSLVEPGSACQASRPRLWVKEG